ncbi:hypothetical protein COT75_03285 [Candidatus Beckwithbacteria bacterium CG10_big_fil_rev_8_21_14_0_10_34_10]|uniref:Uncharacterized protein n=1 Tax=Candidatus Beckwithbacteria bacterium CG10_big_fil_rev_8_21_14_0_10_34_10 TaxID=1974495 RepID=A0A2H0W8X1_9BACT|nr:MAG: hypothetical protein COT75_03285 [Candidatus Beckwithbacteria bacterium CG10_big_fil_rev_8_21_14_0_10_34_10]
MAQGLISLFLLLTGSLLKPRELISPVPERLIGGSLIESKEEILAFQSLDLGDRDENEYLNEVFSKNILLALDYLGFEFVLEPGEVFAFHENVLPEINDLGIGVKTMKSHFIASEGYCSSGYLYGDGVCHLASFLYWAASEAGLETLGLTAHGFQPIPGVPEKYMIAVKYSPLDLSSAKQNLYLVNNLDYSIRFVFKIKGDDLELKVVRKNGYYVKNRKSASRQYW